MTKEFDEKIKEYLERDRKLSLKQSEILRERVELFNFYWNEFQELEKNND